MRLTALIGLLLFAGGAYASSVADSRPAGLSGETWQFGPLNRWAYTHIREILPTKSIPNAGMHVEPIPGLDAARNDLTIELNGKLVRLSEAMRGQYVDGVLVIKDGKAVAELYDGTLTAERTHLMWSVT